MSRDIEIQASTIHIIILYWKSSVAVLCSVSCIVCHCNTRMMLAADHVELRHKYKVRLSEHTYYLKHLAAAVVNTVVP